jgi:tRNA-splicing ligase RtcB
MTYHIRKTWNTVLKTQPHDMQIVYDVAHNIAKLETYDDKKLIIHRKGAARAFWPGHPDLPKAYRKTGQPVLIPGSMGTGSYVLSGLPTSAETFGSACHGAGRRLSRSKAKKILDYQTVMDELAEQHILVRGSHKGILEEAPEAYKDIENVVDIIDHAQIAKKIVKLKPLATIKG